MTAVTGEVEGAVTAETAAALRLKVGSVVHVPGVERGELGVRITGIVAPRQPDNSYWSVESTLGSPALVTKPTNDRPQPRYWRASLLLDPDAAPVLLGTTGEPRLYWRIAPDITALTARDAPRLATVVASLENGPELTELRAPTLVGPRPWWLRDLTRSSPCTARCVRPSLRSSPSPRWGSAPWPVSSW